jgi:excisionase family DNA binding protein
MRLITAKEACESLGIRLPRLYQLSREGRVPCVRLGVRQLRFDPEILKAWIATETIKNGTLTSQYEHE